MTDAEKTVFQNLNATQLENFRAACEQRSYEAGEELIRRGATGDQVFFLQEGKVRVFIAENGDETDLAILEPPAVVGEMELLTGKPRSASVVALTAVTALAMPFDVLRTRLADGDAASLKIVSNIAVVLAQRLSATLEQLTRIERAEAVHSDELQDFRKKLFSDWSF